MTGARSEIAVAIVLTIVIAVPAVAQPAVSSFGDLQGRLQPDQTVYVQTAEVADEDGRGIKGKVIELSGSTLRLSVGRQVREFSARDVLVVSERNTSVRTGLLVGLAIGGGLGLLGVSAACGPSKDAETCEWAKLGLMFGAGFGTTFGAEIGHSIQHERVLFLAPDLRQSRRLTLVSSVGQVQKGLAATIRF